MDALNNKVIGGAVLDVAEPEPCRAITRCGAHRSIDYAAYRWPKHTLHDNVVRVSRNLQRYAESRGVGKCSAERAGVLEIKRLELRRLRFCNL